MIKKLVWAVIILLAVIGLFFMFSGDSGVDSGGSGGNSVESGDLGVAEQVVESSLVLEGDDVDLGDFPGCAGPHGPAY